MPHGTTSTGVWVRSVLAVVSFCILVWGILPVFSCRFHAGCQTMVIVGALGLLTCAFFSRVADVWCRIWQSGLGKVVLSSLTAIAAALVILFISVSICMIGACTSKPSEGSTVIVLGAAIRGDQPSKLLRGRLEAAYTYLQQHPDAVCIVSGGQGADEICTEASVMKRYLVDKGIDSERIYMEEQSTSTFENIRHSREIIEQYRLSQEVAVVTQEFHQCRAQQFVKKAGLTASGAITAHTPWYLLASYWIRDFAGICHMVLLGT